MKYLKTTGFILAAIFCGVFLWAGCTFFPHEQGRYYAPGANLSVAEATRAAAQAMQSVGFTPRQQNEAAGYVEGMKIEPGDPFGLTSGRFYMSAEITKDVQGGMQVTAVCKAGPEVAFADTMPGYVRDFYEAFDRLTGGGISKGSQPAPSESPAQPNAPSTPPSGAPSKQKPAPQPSAPKPSKKVYDL